MMIPNMVMKFYNFDMFCKICQFVYLSSALACCVASIKVFLENVIQYWILVCNLWVEESAPIATSVVWWSGLSPVKLRVTTSERSILWFVVVVIRSAVKALCKGSLTRLLLQSLSLDIKANILFYWLAVTDIYITKVPWGVFYQIKVCFFNSIFISQKIFQNTFKILTV